MEPNSTKETILSIARRIDFTDVPSAEDRTETEQLAFDRVVLAIDDCVDRIREIAKTLGDG